MKRERICMADTKIIVEVAMEISLTPELLENIAQKFSPAAARESAMTTSVGGIGPLLRERIIEEAENGYEIIGVSLLYEHVWMQRWHPWGQLYLEKRKTSNYIKPVLIKCPHVLNVHMYNGSIVAATVWKASYGKAVVFFLESQEITDVVYPGVEDAPPEIADKLRWYEDLRMQQSWLLGRGMLELMKLLQKKPSAVILSETPTMFAWHNLINDGLKNDPLFDQTKYIFNDHTPLEYAHPIWDKERLKSLRVDESYYTSLPNNQLKSDLTDITQLLVAGVDKVYGVARIHGEVMRSMATLKPYAEKIQTITNGVSLDFWQDPAFKNIDQLPDADLLAHKLQAKKILINWIWRRYKLWSAWTDKAVQRPLILWTRRITGYKRLDILIETVKNDQYRKRFIDTDVTILLGGRIHQQDGLSKMVVFKLLDFLAEHPDIENRIVFLDNYNVWEAPKLFVGIDATIMMSDKGKEASATGFMKAQLNGGMVIASPDGAIPESVIFSNGHNNDISPNGFEIKYIGGHPTPDTFLDAIEGCANVYADDTKRAAMMRSAIAMTNQISIAKTTGEMIKLFESLFTPTPNESLISPKKG
ncbi:MAG: glycogen/starch/alpha-glucan phosphorylase [bacterium]